MQGSQFPSFSVVPDAAYSSWLDVRDLAAAYGLVLDPWQENFMRAALGERADGRWAATRVGASVPRQSGKGALLEARELAGLLLFGEQLVIHSAHLVPTALEGFHRIKHYFENFDDLGKRVRRIREGNGDQSVEMMNGARLLFKARSRGSGRGFSADLLVLDEAQILAERDWAAMLPTMSARPNPQAWLAGTPPGPTDDGEAFTRMRQAAKEGADGRLCWLEWSAEGAAVDVRDRKLWAQANPGLGRRITSDAIADELHSMDAATFARERLGMWASQTHLAVIPVEAWAACATPEPPARGTVSYAVDMAPDRSRIAVAACLIPEDGRPHVEVFRHESTGSGTAWVVDLMAARWPDAAAVVIDGHSPAASLVPELLARKVKVTVTGAGDMARACGLLFDAVRDGLVTHYDQEALNVALAGAKKRTIGTGGAWGWDRKAPDADITPLVAATLALFGAATSKRKPGRKARVLV